MLALLQRRVGTMVSSETDEATIKASVFPSPPYQKPLKSSLRPPLIPRENEQEKQEEGFFGSMGKLLATAGSSLSEILGGIFPGFKKKHLNSLYQNQQGFRQDQNKYPSTWPVQDSFVIPDEDEPPTLETRTPTPKKTYPFMTNDAEKMQQLRQSRNFYSGWEQRQQQQHHNRHYSSKAETYYEQSAETTNEIVFGAVQEQDGRRESVVIKPLEHANPTYSFRSRNNSSGFSRDH